MLSEPCLDPFDSLVLCLPGRVDVFFASTGGDSLTLLLEINSMISGISSPLLSSVSESEFVTPLSPPFVTLLLELAVLIGWEEGCELNGTLESVELDEEGPAGFGASGRMNTGCDGTGGAAIASGDFLCKLPSRTRCVGLIDLRNGESGVGVTSASPFIGLTLKREVDFVGVTDVEELFDFADVGDDFFGLPRSRDGSVTADTELDNGEVEGGLFRGRPGRRVFGVAFCNLFGESFDSCEARRELLEAAEDGGRDATTISSSRMLLCGGTNFWKKLVMVRLLPSAALGGAMRNNGRMSPRHIFPSEARIALTRDVMVRHGWTRRAGRRST